MTKKPTYEELQQKIVEFENIVLEYSQSEEEIEKIFKLSLDMIGSGSLDGYFSKINSSFESTLGYPEKDFLEKPFISFVHDDDVKKTGEALSQAAKLSQQILIENRYRCRDGSYKWIDWNVLSIVQDNKFIAVGRDITERKQAEEVLKETEERFRSLVESLNEWVWEVDAEGIYTYVSPQVNDLMGFKPKEILGKTLFDIILSEDKERIFLEMQSIIKDSRPFKNLEKRCRHKDGHVVNFEASGTPVFDKTGVLTGFKGINRDITDRIQSKKMLQNSQARLAALSDASFEAIFISEKGICLDQNKTAEKMFGYSHKEVIGKSGIDWIIPEDRDVVIKNMIAASELSYEVGALRKDGTTFPCEIQARMIDVYNQTVRVTALRDISYRKKIEKEKESALLLAEEQKKLSLVGQVAGKMAHDFNNILGSIMGNTELALMDCNETDIIRQLELIFSQTLRGKNLTKNLVAFARDQEPKQKFFQLGEKIDLVLSLLKRDLERVKLMREYNPEIPDLLADPGMVEHLMVNLIQNSLHATSKVESPCIITRAYHKSDYICFEIEDNGCGIPVEHLKSVFDPAFTLKGSKDTKGLYKANIKGTGYGLSNVKKYIDQHKGRIEIDSTLGSGTKITVSLPVVKKELTKNEKMELSVSINHSGKLILLVEDEPSISNVQYRILSQAPCNHNVDIAPNGKVAIDLFNRNKYDLISLDYILPGGTSGMDVYNHVRECNKKIPILFVSGNIEFLESLEKLRQKDTRMSHLSKPCQNKDYVNSINHLLENMTKKGKL